jgi:hypothetical protein
MPETDKELTVGGDTQVKQEDTFMPKRLWVKAEVGKQAVLYSVSEDQTDDDDVAYVPESLLATVRRETLKDVRERIDSVNPRLSFGIANGSMMKKCILTEIEALEASANSEKGEENADIS